MVGAPTYIHIPLVIEISFIAALPSVFWSVMDLNTRSAGVVSPLPHMKGCVRSRSTTPGDACTRGVLAALPDTAGVRCAQTCSRSDAPGTASSRLSACTRARSADSSAVMRFRQARCFPPRRGRAAALPVLRLPRSPLPAHGSRTAHGRWCDAIRQVTASKFRQLFIKER